MTPTHVSLDDLEDLINCLSAEEIEELAECDPDVSTLPGALLDLCNVLYQDSSMPPYMRCAYKCNKDPTEWKGDENRELLQQGLKEQALAIPDKVDTLKWEKGE